MKVEAQDYLRLVEYADTLVFFDLESTGFRGDYNSILVGSIKPYNSKPTTFKVGQAGNDKAVVREIKEQLEAADVWCTYYGKGFDIPMLNTRLLKWGYKPVEKRPHLDLYFTLKSHLNTSRKSQSHLLSWLGTPEQKMSVGADIWASIVDDPKGDKMKILIERCESDVIGLQDLYDRTKHVIAEITR